MGENSPSERELEILLGENFFTRWREPEEEWFCQFKLFSKLKTAFCEYWTSTKIKVNMPLCPMSMKLKQKLSRNNDCSWKCCFYWVITWKLLFSGGGRELTLVGVGVYWQRNVSRRGEWANFWLVGCNMPHHLQ